MATTPSFVKPGVLPHQAILALCGLKGNQLDESHGQGPVQPCRRENVRSASYDLRLGTDFHFSDGPPARAGQVHKAEVSRLQPGINEQIVLRPNQVVVVSCLEQICMPDDMIGHLTLKQDVLLQGLIMASQSQIDAGYRGWIYPLLYNLTDGEVTLKLGQSIIRLELVRLPEVTREPYGGDYQKQSLAKALRRPIGSSLTKLREDVMSAQKTVDDAQTKIEDAKSKITWTRVFVGLGAVGLAILGFFLPYLTGIDGRLKDTRESVKKIEGKLEDSPERDRVTRLETRVAELQCEVRAAADNLQNANC